MAHINYYSTKAAHNADYNGPAYLEPWIGYVESTEEVTYNYDWSQRYLTFEAIENGTFTFTNALEYSTNNGSTWTLLAANTATPTVNMGNKIMFRASIAPTSSAGVGTFSATGQFNASGNPLSLLYGDNFQGVTDLTGKDYAMTSMFKGNKKLVSAKKLKLSATTLAQYCYSSMFSGCSSLTTPPALPATTLAQYCYYNMFNNCSRLTSAPALPATTLAQYCYSTMFLGCSALSAAPALPATTLVQGCYYRMFKGAYYIHMPDLPATTLARSCYEEMFYGCTSMSTFKVLPATTLAPYCYRKMFYDCGHYNASTPSDMLPATTLATGCYESMFEACSDLRSIPDLPATTLVTDCYKNMFKGASLRDARPVLPALTLVSGCYVSLFHNCGGLTYVKAMFLTTPSDTYTSYWMQGTSSNTGRGTFVKNSAATWTNTGVNAVPAKWTIETASE